MKKYLFAMMIANASLLGCVDLKEDETLCNHDICYNDQIVQLHLYDGVNNFDNYNDDDLSEDENESGDLDEGESLATYISYIDEDMYDFDNWYGEIIKEEESDSGDHPGNQDNELIAWM